MYRIVNHVNMHVAPKAKPYNKIVTEILSHWPLEGDTMDNEALSGRDRNSDKYRHFISSVGSMDIAVGHCAS